MLTNLVFTVAVVAEFGSNKDGIVTTLDGDCSEVSSWSTYLHVAINALSSILLAASNYTQQAVASPSREDIDAAHAKGDWLDIGIPSVRNILGRIPWKRQVVWWYVRVP